VRGELLTRLGRTDEARSELVRAARLCANARERSVLERKIRELG
jgi:predicted RNA polymerase sigma factor